MQVGRVGRPHGLDGAFVVERGSEDESRYAVGAVLHVDGEPATIVALAPGRARPATRSGSTARSSAGRSLTVPRAELPALPEGEFYAFEIIGLRVEEEGGRVVRSRPATCCPGRPTTISSSTTARSCR